MTENPMPLLEVGDWIQADGRIGRVTGPGDGPAAVRATTSPFYVLLKEINEVRKADGTHWLRDPEPPSPPPALDGAKLTEAGAASVASWRPIAPPTSPDENALVWLIGVSGVPTLGRWRDYRTYNVPGIVAWAPAPEHQQYQKIRENTPENADRSPAGDMLTEAEATIARLTKGKE